MPSDGGSTSTSGGDGGGYGDFGGEFSEAEEACQSVNGYVFGAPRSAYENAILRIQMEVCMSVRSMCVGGQTATTVTISFAVSVFVLCTLAKWLPPRFSNAPGYWAVTCVSAGFVSYFVLCFFAHYLEIISQALEKDGGGALRESSIVCDHGSVFRQEFPASSQGTSCIDGKKQNVVGFGGLKTRTPAYIHIPTKR